MAAVWLWSDGNNTARLTQSSRRRALNAKCYALRKWPEHASPLGSLALSPCLCLRPDLREVPLMGFVVRSLPPQAEPPVRWKGQCIAKFTCDEAGETQSLLPSWLLPAPPLTRSHDPPDLKGPGGDGEKTCFRAPLCPLVLSWLCSDNCAHTLILGKMLQYF